MSAAEIESVETEKRWWREQYRAKLPFLAVALAVISCEVLYGIFTYDPYDSRRGAGGDWIFIGVYGLIVAFIWFCFSRTDCSHPWRQLKEAYWRALHGQPIVETEESKDSLPTSFSGWLRVVVGTCGLIWYLVSLVWRASEWILN